jgi:hypothetical protein
MIAAGSKAGFYCYTLVSVRGSRIGGLCGTEGEC